MSYKTAGYSNARTFLAQHLDIVYIKMQIALLILSDLAASECNMKHLIEMKTPLCTARLYRREQGALTVHASIIAVSAWTD